MELDKHSLLSHRPEYVCMYMQLLHVHVHYLGLDCLERVFTVVVSDSLWSFTVSLQPM